MTGVAKIRAHGQNTAVSAVNKGTVSASNANIAQLLTTQNSLPACSSLQQQSKTPPAAAAEATYGAAAAGAAEAAAMPTLNQPDAAHHPIQHAPHVQ